jgi:hypothetical protein
MNSMRPYLIWEAIRSHQRSSEVIRGHQRSSEVIRGHQGEPRQGGHAATYSSKSVKYFAAARRMTITSETPYRGKRKRSLMKSESGLLRPSKPPLPEQISAGCSSSSV